MPVNVCGQVTGMPEACLVAIVAATGISKCGARICHTAENGQLLAGADDYDDHTKSQTIEIEQQMRAALALIIALAVGGCSGAGWRAFPDALFGDDSEATPASGQPATLSNTKCRELAFDRSSDVADQGFDESVRRAVFTSTYSDCVAWAARGTTEAAR